MNSPMYSIEREVIKEFETQVSNLSFALWVHKNVFSCFSFDTSFSQMAAKRSFDPYNQLNFW